MLFGFAALCVLSTPNLIDQFSYETSNSVYRTIASSEEFIVTDRSEDFDKENLEAFIDGTREDLTQLINKRDSAIEVLDSERSELFEEEKEKLVSDIANIKKGLESINKQVTSIEEKVDDKENKSLADLRADLADSEKVVENISKRAESIQPVVRDISACEFRNELDELSEQIKELLRDKEEAVAEVKDDNKKDKKDKKDDKEDNSEKVAEKEDKEPTRFEKLFSMGMVFGKGFQQSFRMPGIRNYSNSFMSFNPYMNLRTNNSPWLSFMQPDFTGVAQMLGQNTPRVDQSRSFNNVLGQAPQSFIPNFSRTTIEAETISFN